MDSSSDAATSRGEQEDTPLAVRWCLRCRRRRSLEPEWGFVSGLYVCSSCVATADPRRRYNFVELDPIVDVDPMLGSQRVRLVHVDVITPRSAMARNFGKDWPDESPAAPTLAPVRPPPPEVERPAKVRRSRVRSRHPFVRKRSSMGGRRRPVWFALVAVDE